MNKEILKDFLIYCISFSVINIILYFISCFLWWEWLNPFNTEFRIIYTLEFVLTIFVLLEEYIN